jgi:hypothetical protein
MADRDPLGDAGEFMSKKLKITASIADPREWFFYYYL